MLHEATALEIAWCKPTGGDQPINTIRLNDTCLCAISHVIPRLMGSPMTVRSMRVK